VGFCCATLMGLSKAMKAIAFSDRHTNARVNKRTAVDFSSICSESGV